VGHRIMRVLISGARGFIGTALGNHLSRQGHAVSRLIRSNLPLRSPDVAWDPEQLRLERQQIENFDAVIHLAGESIAAHRWSAEQKLRIRNSRVATTKFLADTLAGLAHPPAVLFCASAIGYYGNRGFEALTEDSSSGQGFLPEVCVAWEAAAESARSKGIRVAHMRFGVVLSNHGGALAQMLLPFRLGLGGRIGNGAQFMSWITLEDAIRGVDHLLSNNITGAVNFVSPHPVCNSDFVKTLGKVLNRPAITPLPAFAARLALGEMVDELLLASTRVLPKRLLDSGFQFRYPELETALRAILKDPIHRSHNQGNPPQ
jgi:uncharacterized protein